MVIDHQVHHRSAVLDGLVAGLGEERFVLENDRDVTTNGIKDLLPEAAHLFDVLGQAVVDRFPGVLDTLAPDVILLVNLVEACRGDAGFGEAAME